jgi:dephospho-CoA kinase
VRRVLITGMSGTGKSTLIAELRKHGYKAVDTDWDPNWEEPDTDHDGGPGWVWREDRIQALLSAEDSELLFVSACVPNQDKFYSQFEHIVLLSAPVAVTIERLAGRTNNPYGKQPQELVEVLHYKETVEPMLRSAATIEIDTSISLSEVIATLLDTVCRREIAPG